MLFFASIYSLLRWGSAKAHHSILASIVVMYIMSTAQFALRLRLVYIELLKLLPNILVPDQGPNVYKMQSLVLVVAQTVPLSINIVLSDIIVLWRICIIWSRNRAVVGISVFLSLLIIVTYIICNVREVLQELGSSSPDVSTDIIGPIAFSASLFSNLWTTCMVAYRTWRFYSRIRNDLEHSTKRDAAENILALLVESGALYSILWMIYFISAFDTNVLGLSGIYVSVAMSQITGIYPTSIFLLVSLEKTRLGGILDSSNTLPIMSEVSVCESTPVPLSATYFLPHRSTLDAEHIDFIIKIEENRPEAHNVSVS